MLAQTESDITVRLRISTSEIQGTRRPAVNLVLAMDTSGSMKGEAIDGAREAAMRVLKELHDGDRLAVVAFHSKGEVIVPSTEISSLSRAQILGKIGKISATGTTNLQAGMSLAVSQLQKHRMKNGVNRLILLSDGIPNNPEAIQALINQAKAAAIPVTALGFGLDYDESLLARIASQTGGSFLFVEEADKVAEVFVNEVIRLQQVVARNMVLALTPGPGLAIVDVFGSEIGFSGRVASLALGDHSLGEVRDVIVRLRGTSRRDGSSVEVLDSTLSFEDALGGAGRFERTVFIGAESVADVAKLEEGRNPDVEISAARAEAAAATVKAIAMARAGQLEPARKSLVEAEKRARETAKLFNDDIVLLELADAMLELDKVLPTFVGQVLRQPVPQPDPSSDAAPMSEAEVDAVPAVVRRKHREAVKTLQGR